MDGDWLSTLALKYLGNANRWPEIYDANKSVIENAAKTHPGPPVSGTSDHGHWIFPGTVLTIPGTGCAPPAPTAPKTTDVCAEPTFLLAARGSGEKGEDKFPGSHNLGGEPAQPKKPGRRAKPAQPSALSLLYQSLNQPAGSTGVYGVPYEAIPGAQFAPESHFGSTGPIVPESTEAGATLLAREILKHAACKDQKILLAGYSQGGVVVREALKQLPADVLNKISGIALFGDPKRVGAKLNSLPVDLSQRTISQCGKDDPICDESMPIATRVAAVVGCGLNAPPELCLHFSYQGGARDLAATYLNKLPKR
ncbi:cutinase family protein [Streptomyces mirabilis]|uniref:cutinase family protein n=1 Tax=Streptomyces mirabilis TaxID=68239 RepID=UPI0036CEB42C